MLPQNTVRDKGAYLDQSGKGSILPSYLPSTEIRLLEGCSPICGFSREKINHEIDESMTFYPWSAVTGLTWLQRNSILNIIKTDVSRVILNGS